MTLLSDGGPGSTGPWTHYNEQPRGNQVNVYHASQSRCRVAGARPGRDGGRAAAPARL